MAKNSFHRKLTAILSADVAGYSRLMGEDEEGTDRTLKKKWKRYLDVIQDGDRIYGDGVTVAARMESLADAGEICISRTAYDQVKSKIKIDS